MVPVQVKVSRKARLPEPESTPGSSASSPTPRPQQQQQPEYTVGQDLSGVVTEVLPFGAVVRIGDSTATGFVHISELQVCVRVRVCALVGASCWGARW